VQAIGRRGASEQGGGLAKGAHPGTVPAGAPYAGIAAPRATADHSRPSVTDADGDEATTRRRAPQWKRPSSVRSSCRHLLPDDPDLSEPLEVPDDEWRSRSDVDCPSPWDELPRSRFELPEEALLPL
jgi:hypothetical protein